MVKPFVKTKKLIGKDADKAIRLIKKHRLSPTQEKSLYMMAENLVKIQSRKSPLF